jgi:hypothetical protein
MTTLKSLMMVSALLLVGGAGPFCATANELPGGNINDRPPVAAAPDNATPIPPRTARRHETKHHFPTMYMSARGKKGTPKTGLPNGGY